MDFCLQGHTIRHWTITYQCWNIITCISFTGLHKNVLLIIFIRCINTIKQNLFDCVGSGDLLQFNILYILICSCVCLFQPKSHLFIFYLPNQFHQISILTRIQHNVTWNPISIITAIFPSSFSSRYLFSLTATYYYNLLSMTNGSSTN